MLWWTEHTRARAPWSVRGFMQFPRSFARHEGCVWGWSEVLSMCRNSSRVVRLLALSSIVAASAACAKDDEPAGATDSYGINEINASYGIGADQTTLTIRAALLKGGFLRVGAGDTVTIEVAGKPVPTFERVDGGRVHTIAEVKPPPAGGTEVAIIFQRSAERVVSKALVAPPFELAAPPASAKRGELVTVDLTPRPDLTQWKGPLGGSTLRHGVIVRGECIEKGEMSLDGCAADSPNECKQGYPFTFDTTKLKLTQEAECDVDVEVQLRTNGSPFAGEGPTKQSFAGGGFDAVQFRGFKLRLR